MDSNGVYDNHQITLNTKTKFCFGLGHIFNDLCSAVWFTYALIFYKMNYTKFAYTFLVFGIWINNFSGLSLFFVDILGQTVDAVATTLIGFFFDTNTKKRKLFKLGKYKTWYFIGTILFFISFPMTFAELPLIVDNQSTVFAVYFTSIMVSQIGWSFVQISHLSLINDISINSADRIWLNAVR